MTLSPLSQLCTRVPIHRREKPDSGLACLLHSISEREIKLPLKRLVLILGAVANAGVGFYIVGQVFVGTPLALPTELILLCCVGVPIGIVSGLVFKSCQILDLFLSMFPILGFLGLFLGGAIEKGSGRNVAFAVGTFCVPLMVQGGLWLISARLANRTNRGHAP